MEVRALAVSEAGVGDLAPAVAPVGEPSQPVSSCQAAEPMVACATARIRIDRVGIQRSALSNVRCMC